MAVDVTVDVKPPPSLPLAAVIGVIVPVEKLISVAVAVVIEMDLVERAVTVVAGVVIVVFVVVVMVGMPGHEVSQWLASGWCVLPVHALQVLFLDL